MGVGWIVSMVLDIAARKNADAHGLQQGGNQQRRNINVPGTDTPVSKAKENGRGTVEAL